VPILRWAICGRSNDTSRGDVAAADSEGDGSEDEEKGETTGVL
jgi:hypothetical protein